MVTNDTLIVPAVDSLEDQLFHTSQKMAGWETVMHSTPYFINHTALQPIGLIAERGSLFCDPFFLEQTLS